MTPIDVAYLLAGGAAAPWFARGRSHLWQKLTGRVNVAPKTLPRVWFHGVSVGEVHLLRTVLSSFRARRPDVEPVVSSTTSTGLAEARRCFPDLPVVPWPFDFSWACRRARNEIKPDVIVLAESELWPGMLLEAHRTNVPVVVINGRLSPRSLRRWQWASPLARMMFGRVSRFAVQSPEYGANLVRLGVPAERVVVTGSVKFDGVETRRDNPATARLREPFAIEPGETVLIAGSTQAPEEQGVLEIYRRLQGECPRLRLIIVPRQADRFDEVAGLIGAAGFACLRRTRIDGASRRARNEVILVDTIGELRAVWGLADVAFVGGSLDGKRGGQNMIEPAAYGAAVVFGDQVWNFAAMAEQLVNLGGAVAVDGFPALESALRRFLDPVQRARYGRTARQFVSSQQGATARTLDLIDQFLPNVSRLAA